MFLTPFAERQQNRFQLQTHLSCRIFDACRDLCEDLPGHQTMLLHLAQLLYQHLLGDLWQRADRCAVTPLLPMLLGVEVAGVVEKVGEGVDGTRLGTRVAVPLFALGGGGGYAEYVAVDAGYAVPIPERLPFSGVTALVVQGLTALHMVQQSSLMGKTVLVHAAAGGVGSLLTQLARRRGTRRVIATAVSAAKRSLALEMGANLAIDYSAPGWEMSLAGLRPDVVYDTIGGDMTRASLAVLADGGELVFAAGLQPQPRTLPVRSTRTSR